MPLRSDSSSVVFGCLMAIGMLSVAGCATTQPGNTNDNANTNTNTSDNGNSNVNDNANDNINDNVSVEGKPLTRFETDLFSGSGTCATCHSDLTDGDGNDVSIDTFWRSTMMANAATDPFWQAMVASEVARHPELREVIEDTCANCHMPMAHFEAALDGTSTAVLDDGFLSPDNPLHEAAMDGVSCTLCHQIEEDNLGQLESFSGAYVIDETTPKPDRVNYGPYEDPHVPAMQASSGYIPVAGEHTGGSGMCATCHTLYTPYLDADGNIAGEFPEQTPFLEWQHSRFGDGTSDDVACRDCHMPSVTEGAVISTVPSGLPQRSPFYRHMFVGGNVFMLRVLRDNIEALGLTASTEDFNATIERTEQQLRNGTATLFMSVLDRTDAELRVGLDIITLTGHKFPSGFPSRRAWIRLSVTNDAGILVFESGAPYEDGSIDSNDAATPGGFEPHYDTITSADQVQIYEAIMENTDGDVTYTLLRAAAYAKDNRLLPEGFDKASADADFAVYGAAAADDDFVGGSDHIDYVINIEGTPGPFTVTAELLYQSVSLPLINDLRQDTEELVVDFGQMFDAADKTPSLIDVATETVP